MDENSKPKATLFSLALLGLAAGIVTVLVIVQIL